MDEDRFNRLLNGWIQHINGVPYKSGIEFFLECEAYRELCRGGTEVFPLVRKTIESDQGRRIPVFAWTELARNLLNGQLFIPYDLTGDIDGTRAYVLEAIGRAEHEYA